jgi:hypothetical protein
VFCETMSLEVNLPLRRAVRALDEENTKEVILRFARYLMLRLPFLIHRSTARREMTCICGEKGTKK